jgi:flagellin
MRINHNLSAMNAQRLFGINNGNLKVDMERLSSGMRVNRSRDDAAGLAISERMRGQIRGFNMASRNAQDGISLIQTAEGWLQESTDVVQRMRELSVQAANGVYTNEDRYYIGLEMAQLVDEVDRIANQAQFSAGSQLILNGTAFGSTDPAAIAERAHIGKLDGDTGAAATAGTGLPMTTITSPDDAAVNKLVVHIGPNTDQRIAVTIDRMDSVALQLKEDGGATKIGVNTVDEANQSIQVLDNSLQIINHQRAQLGAFQNRLEHSIRGIDYAAENLQAAESKIRDSDMAKEMVDFVKDQILSQSTASMLAQANMKPQVVMRILG